MDFLLRMPCHNQEMNGVNSGQDHPVKQVRFANNGSNNNVPAVLTTADEPSDVSPQLSQEDLGPQLKLLPLNDQIRELQTIIRDKWVPVFTSSLFFLDRSKSPVNRTVHFQNRKSKNPC